MSGGEADNRLMVLGTGTAVNIYRQAANTLNTVGGLHLAAAGTGASSVPIATRFSVFLSV